MDLLSVGADGHDELGHLVEPAEQGLWRPAQVGPHGGQHGEQGLSLSDGHDSVGHGRFVLRVEGGQRGPQRRAFALQFVVVAAQCLGERVGGVALLDLAADVALPPLQVSDLPIERGAVGGALLGGTDVRAVHLGREEGDAVVAEDPFGEEVGHSVAEDVLAEPDRLRVTFEQVFSATVVRPWPADVVTRLARRTGSAVHPPAAGAEHQAPEQVGARRTGADVEVVAAAGAFLAPGAGVELVVHPLGDERLVDGFQRPDPLLRTVGFVGA
nr:hypothetical protein [Frankia nepalensis]